MRSMGNNASSTFTYWPVGNDPYVTYSTGNTFYVTTTAGTLSSPQIAITPVVEEIPNYKESEVGRLRRSVLDLCAEGRMLLEAA